MNDGGNHAARTRDDSSGSAGGRQRAWFPFDDLLQALRHRGFVIDVEHHLRLLRLLEEVGTAVAPTQLKELLCPLFATDEEQQRVFHGLFDELYPSWRLDPEARAERSFGSPSAGRSAPRSVRPASPARPRRRPSLLAGALLLLGLLATGSYVVFRPALRQALSETEAAAGQERAGEPAALPSPDRSLAVPKIPSAPKPLAVIASPTRWVLVALPCLFFALFELYRRHRTMVVLRRRSISTPPFVWPLRLDAPVRTPFDSRRVRVAARQMRARAPADWRRLDVEKSIAATVAAVGRVQLRYRAATRIPEYLALVDRCSPGDHWAGFSDELCRALEREGVFVHRFSFDRDPRVCRSHYGETATLRELADRYRGDRLLLFTDGAGLVDPLSGVLAAWSASFEAWSDRAVLSPLPLSEWSWRELALASRFWLVPGTAAALSALTECFGAEPQAGAELLGLVARGDRIEELGDPQVATLEASLGEHVFQWLCTCAVHSELQWDLTLYLATLPGMPSGLLTEAKLLRLVRLPWFRQGRIPARLRWQLIRRLPPALEETVRRHLTRLLEQHPPPARSVAADARELQLAIQRTVLDGRDRRRRAPHVRRLLSFPPSRWHRDDTALRLMETLRSSVLDPLVPRRLRRALYREGIPVHGLRTLPLSVLALLLSGLVWMATRPPATAASEPIRFAVTPVPRSVGESLFPSERREARPTERPAVPPGNAPGSEVASSTPPAEEGLRDADLAPGSEPAAAPLGAVWVSPSPPPLQVPGTPPPASSEGGPQTEPTVTPEVAAAVVAAPMPAPSERPAVRVDEVNGVTVVVPLDLRRDDWQLEVPLGVHQRPVYYPNVQLEIGRSWLRKPFVAATAQFWSAGPPGLYGLFTGELLDADGVTLAKETKRQRLGGGGDTVRARFTLDDSLLESAAAIRLSLTTEMVPGPFARLRSERTTEQSEPARLAAHLVQVEGERATLLLPLDLGEALVEVLVGPIDLVTVRCEVDSRRVRVALFVTNAWDHDRVVSLQAVLLDASGRTIGEAADRREVEEGQRSKKLEVTWRLDPAEREVATAVRLLVSSQPN